MRDLRLLDAYRARELELAVYGTEGDETCGVFVVPSQLDGGHLRIIASSVDGWDHVSVSRSNRVPNWAEMQNVRHLFFKDDETVMQLHVPIKEHLNLHPNCLHMWRPQGVEIPRPPSWMVAPKLGGKE